jgi:hypothetical protein
MPAADPEFAAELAKTTLQVYSEAVDRLLSMISRRLTAGIDQPGWAEEKLWEQITLRNQAQVVVDQLAVDGPAAITEALTAAYRKGSAEVATGFAATHTRGLDALIRETVTAVESTHLQIVRSTVDIFRQVVTEASLPGVLTGTQTTRQAAQSALNRFANQGITGFTDRTGRADEGHVAEKLLDLARDKLAASDVELRGIRVVLGRRGCDRRQETALDQPGDLGLVTNPLK